MLAEITEMEMSPLAPPLPEGKHILAELAGCPMNVLDCAATLETSLCRAAVAGGATVVSSHFHHFSPQGVSGVIIIAESHITIHTWPECGYAALDVFTCGRPEIAESVMTLAIEALQAGSVQRTSFARGPHMVPVEI